MDFGAILGPDYAETNVQETEVQAQVEDLIPISGYCIPHSAAAHDDTANGYLYFDDVFAFICDEKQRNLNLNMKSCTSRHPCVCCCSDLISDPTALGCERTPTTHTVDTGKKGPPLFPHESSQLSSFQLFKHQTFDILHSCYKSQVLRSLNALFDRVVSKMGYTAIYSILYERILEGFETKKFLEFLLIFNLPLVESEQRRCHIDDKKFVLDISIFTTLVIYGMNDDSVTHEKVAFI
ncbi:hypothetical protein ADUPG1_008962 [Aduncisulcus paluster]|uniref:Uncharacterized protein n=1 Tax=Aduncisulcus paluster TaxID=2918883 RepID=A0ABQ5KTV3_9EUKA|nr:hypothetical protein ADUPG1_008962 [Aduncisulcus paluster]